MADGDGRAGSVAVVGLTSKQLGVGASREAGNGVGLWEEMTVSDETGGNYVMYRRGCRYRGARGRLVPALACRPGWLAMAAAARRVLGRQS